MVNIKDPRQKLLFDPFEHVFSKLAYKKIGNGWQGVFRHAILELELRPVGEGLEAEDLEVLEAHTLLPSSGAARLDGARRSTDPTAVGELAEVRSPSRSAPAPGETMSEPSATGPYPVSRPATPLP